MEAKTADRKKLIRNIFLDNLMKPLGIFVTLLNIPLIKIAWEGGSKVI